MDLGKELRELTVHPMQWPTSEPVVVPEVEPAAAPQEVEAE